MTITLNQSLDVLYTAPNHNGYRIHLEAGEQEVNAHLAQYITEHYADALFVAPVINAEVEVEEEVESSKKKGKKEVEVEELTPSTEEVTE